MSARRLGSGSVLVAWLVLSCGSSPAPRPDEGAGARHDRPGLADSEAELERLTRDVVVASRRRLRECYEEALVRAPAMEGRVVLVLDVGQNGRAARVLEAHRQGLDEEVVRCLARVLRTLAFHDGAARTVRIQVPLAFSRKDDGSG